MDIDSDEEEVKKTSKAKGKGRGGKKPTPARPKKKTGAPSKSKTTKASQSDSDEEKDQKSDEDSKSKKEEEEECVEIQMKDTATSSSLGKRKAEEMEGEDHEAKKRRVEPPVVQVKPPPEPPKQPTDDKIITFVLQGKKLATFQSTLTKIPGTKLAETFKVDKPDVPTNEDGHFMLDRPRKAFLGVINYLRSGKFYVPKEPEGKAELEAEIEYWGFGEQYQKDSSGGWALYEGSTLLEKTQQRTLNDWFGKSDKRWKLLYKASKDGWEASDFHKKCDKKGPTMTIISAQNCLFGGYTPIHWESRGDYAFDDKTWIFSLTNPTNTPTKLVNVSGPRGKDSKYSICDKPDHGPTFGGGHDIVVLSGANTASQNYAHIGYSFTCPGKTLGAEEAKNFMTGTQYFTIADVEVFGFADAITVPAATNTTSTSTSTSTATSTTSSSSAGISTSSSANKV